MQNGRQEKIGGFFRLENSLANGAVHWENAIDNLGVNFLCPRDVLDVD